MPMMHHPKVIQGHRFDTKQKPVYHFLLASNINLILPRTVSKFSCSIVAKFLLQLRGTSL